MKGLPAKPKNSPEINASMIASDCGNLTLQPMATGKKHPVC